MEISKLDMNRLMNDTLSDDFRIGVDRLKEIVGISVHAVNSVQSNLKESIPHLQYFNSLLQKSLDHSVSIINILDSLKEDEDTSYFLSSIYILSRAQFESYLMLIYLYFEEVNSDEKNLRFLIFEYAGLTKRQEHKPLKKELLEKFNSETKDLENLKERLQLNETFQKQNSKTRKDILRGLKSKMVSSTHLIYNSPFLKNEIFQRTWALQSNYAHSEYISVIQTDHFLRNKEEAKESVKDCLTVTSVICGALINDLMEFDKDLIPETQFNNYQKNCIRFYKGFATEEPPYFLGY